MKAYKGTDKDMKCYGGYQYELGKTHKHNGAVIPCNSGLHSCINPLDVLHYYSAANGSRYFEVESEGKIREHNDDSKIACSQLTLTAEINLMTLIKTGIKMVFDRVKTLEPTEKNKIVIGNSGTAAQNGNWGTAAQTGDSGTAAQTGDSGTAAVSGKQSIALANGYNSAAKGKKGCYIVITEYDDNRNLINCKCHKVDGKIIKEDVFYKLKDGKFVEAKL